MIYFAVSLDTLTLSIFAAIGVGRSAARWFARSVGSQQALWRRRRFQCRCCCEQDAIGRQCRSELNSSEQDKQAAGLAGLLGPINWLPGPKRRTQ